MTGYRVLVVGGYGLFGGRLVRRLARQPGLQVFVAGRSLTAAQALVRQLQPVATTQLEAVACDAMTLSLDETLARLRPAVLVHTGGPFQGQDYRVARACLRSGTHYIDLADGREFVSGIGALQDAAVAAGVTIISGASSVPALSGAAADRLAAGLQGLHTIDIGISP